MTLSRREFMAVSAGVATFVSVGSMAGPALAANDTNDLISAFTGGKEPTMGRVDLTAPEIAENGNTVPIEVAVDCTMTGEDVCESVMIVADGNPNGAVATFHFSEMSGEAAATTRIRLARSQNVIAVAKMKDGTFLMDKKAVKVTIGGCGG